MVALEADYRGRARRNALEQRLDLAAQMAAKARLRAAEAEEKRRAMEVRTRLSSNVYGAEDAMYKGYVT